MSILRKRADYYYGCDHPRCDNIGDANDFDPLVPNKPGWCHTNPYINASEPIRYYCPEHMQYGIDLHAKEGVKMA